MRHILTKTHIETAINLLFIVAGFVIFIDYKTSRTILIAILFLWLLSGDYKKKLLTLWHDKFVITFVLFVGLFIIGMLWTENFDTIKKTITRPLLYLIAPVMLTAYKPKYLKYYLWSMLSALIFTALVTLFIKTGIIDYPYSPGKSPFVNRVYLAGMILFAYSYFLYQIDFTTIKKFTNIIWAILAVLMIYTLVVSGSRMGMINLFVATFIVLVYKIDINYKKLFTIAITTLLLAIASYHINTTIQHKVDHTIDVLQHMNMKAQIFNHETDRRRSLTCRFEFWYYAWSLGKEYPLLGVGTGDGIEELGKLIGKKEEQQLFDQCLGDGSGQFNPHNMYLFMFMQFGILGVAVLLWMLYIQLKTAVHSKNPVFTSLVVTTILAIFSLSELFTSKYYIMFYGYAATLMYLLYLENKKRAKESLKQN